MKRHLALLIACLFSVTAASGAAFIKIEGVDGESQDADHIGWSDILFVQQSIHKPGGRATGPTRRRGDVVLEDIGVVKELDKSSPKIAESILKGAVVPTVNIEVTTILYPSDTVSVSDLTVGSPERLVFLEYELVNVQITSYNVDVDAQGQVLEEFTLNFEEITVTYTEYDDDGSSLGKVEYTWKVEKGRR